MQHAEQCLIIDIDRQLADVGARRLGTDYRLQGAAAADVAAGAQSVITDQVTNGVAIRMALLYLLAGVAGAGPGGSAVGAPAP